MTALLFSRFLIERSIGNKNPDNEKMVIYYSKNDLLALPLLDSGFAAL